MTEHVMAHPSALLIAAQAYNEHRTGNLDSKVLIQIEQCTMTARSLMLGQMHYFSPGTRMRTFRPLAARRDILRIHTSRTRTWMRALSRLAGEISIHRNKSTEWVAAVIQEPIDSNLLRPKPTPPVRVDEFVVPSSVVRVPNEAKEAQETAWFIDFGKEAQMGLSVTFWIDADALVGAKVHVQMGEERIGAYGVLSHLKAGNVYEETWTLRRGEQVFEQHEYSEFRFARLTIEANSTIKMPSVKAWRVMYDADYSEATFICSDEIINQVHSFCNWTQVATTLDMYTDSNTRQRDVMCMESISIHPDAMEQFFRVARSAL